MGGPQASGNPPHCVLHRPNLPKWGGDAPAHDLAFRRGGPYFDLPGKLGAQLVFHTQIKGHSCGKSDQHRGGKDADIGQAHRVFLHTEHEARNGGEIAPPIIIFLAAFQQF